MKAMLLTAQEPIENKPLQWVDFPEPKIKPTDLLIKISSCGICRTDLHIIEGDIPLKTAPIVPGHQIIGIVVKQGKACAKFKVGDRVGLGWLQHTCGHCQYCSIGRENLCENSQYTGYHAHGGYAEFTAAPEAFAYPIPSQFSDEMASPLLCAGIIGYRALQRSHLPSRGRLGIFGFGSSAHVIIQIALHRGSEVFVISRNAKHREMAKAMGAHWVGSAMDSLPAKLDSVIVFAPAGEIVPAALKSLNKGGTAVLAGIYMSPIPAMNYEDHLFHEKQLVSIESNTREDGEKLIEEAAKIHLLPHVTLFDLTEANEALIKLKHDEINGTAVLMMNR